MSSFRHISIREILKTLKPASKTATPDTSKPLPPTPPRARRGGFTTSSSPLCHKVGNLVIKEDAPDASPAEFAHLAHLHGPNTVWCLWCHGPEHPPTPTAKKRKVPFGAFNPTAKPMPSILVSDKRSAAKVRHAQIDCRSTPNALTTGMSTARAQSTSKDHLIDAFGPVEHIAPRRKQALDEPTPSSWLRCTPSPATRTVSSVDSSLRTPTSSLAPQVETTLSRKATPTAPIHPFFALSL